jgi:hypothetical protein
VLANPDVRLRYETELGFQSSVQCRNPSSAPLWHADNCPVIYYTQSTAKRGSDGAPGASSSSSNSSAATLPDATAAANDASATASESSSSSSSSSSDVTPHAAAATADDSSSSDSETSSATTATATESHQGSSSSSSSSDHSSRIFSFLVYVGEEIVSALKTFIILGFAIVVFLAIDCIIEETHRYFHPV